MGKLRKKIILVLICIFTVTITSCDKADLNILGLNVDTTNAKIMYSLGEEFNTNGIVLTKSLSNDKVLTVSKEEYVFDISAYNKNVIGTYPITLKLSSDQTKSVTYNVSVAAKVNSGAMSLNEALVLLEQVNDSNISNNAIPTTISMNVKYSVYEGILKISYNKDSVNINLSVLGNNIFDLIIDKMNMYINSEILALYLSDIDSTYDNTNPNFIIKDYTQQLKLILVEFVVSSALIELVNDLVLDLNLDNSYILTSERLQNVDFSFDEYFDEIISLSNDLQLTEFYNNINTQLSMFNINLSEINITEDTFLTINTDFDLVIDNIVNYIYENIQLVFMGFISYITENYGYIITQFVPDIENMKNGNIDYNTIINSVIPLFDEVELKFLVDSIQSNLSLYGIDISEYGLTYDKIKNLEVDYNALIEEINTNYPALANSIKKLVIQELSKVLSVDVSSEEGILSQIVIKSTLIDSLEIKVKFNTNGFITSFSVKNSDDNFSLSFVYSEPVISIPTDYSGYQVLEINNLMNIIVG